MLSTEKFHSFDRFNFFNFDSFGFWRSSPENPAIYDPGSLAWGLPLLRLRAKATLSAAWHWLDQS
jgi:hypothetical protein